MKLTTPPQRKHKGLIIGSIDKSNQAYIDDVNRKKHTVILGAKGTGKSDIVLPAMVKQDLEDKRHGTTIVTGNKETAMLLYSLAKRNNRDVQIIKPSITDSGKALLSQCSYHYNTIKQDVVNFEQAIRKKEVVIIDMEFSIHKEKSIEGVAYLLHAFHEAMIRENETKETPHHLYVDDTHLYFPYVQSVLMDGNDYGVGCTLFLESRQFLTDTEKAYLDSATRNKIILSGLTISDAKYISEEIYERQLVYILNRKRFEVIYLTESRGMRASGVCQFIPLEEELMASLRLSVPRHRGNIERSQVSKVHENEAIPTSSSLDKTKSKKDSKGSNGSVKSDSKNSDTVASETTTTTTTTTTRLEQIESPVVLSVDRKNELVKEKEKMTMPEQRQRDKVRKQIQTEVKRHVVVLENLFDEDEEF